MRHRVAHRKLGRTTAHRTALLRNLAVALFDLNERRCLFLADRADLPVAARVEDAA